MSDDPFEMLSDEELAGVEVPSPEAVRRAFAVGRERVRKAASRGYTSRMANPVAVEFKKGAAEAEKKGVLIPFVLDKLLLAEVAHGEVSERMEAFREAQERSERKLDEALERLNSATDLLSNYANAQVVLAQERREREAVLEGKVDSLRKAVEDLYESVGQLLAGQAHNETKMGKLSAVKLGIGGGVFVTLDVLIRLIIEAMKG